MQVWQQKEWEWRRSQEGQLKNWGERRRQVRQWKEREWNRREAGHWKTKCRRGQEGKKAYNTWVIL